MAKLDRVTQRSYQSDEITRDTAQALVSLADILAQIQDAEDVDLTVILNRVRSNPDYAAATVFACLIAIPATTETIARMKAQARAMRRYIRSIRKTA